MNDITLLNSLYSHKVRNRREKNHKNKQNKTAFLTPTFCTVLGIPVITYNVGTKDGFVLQVQRMKREGASAVYLQHGLLDSSCTWVMNTRVESLGFALYDAGYDVWLGNSRGNRFSNQMVNGSHFDWYWSMDELAQYDVDAVLNYVTNTTGKDRIAWIGHSRGKHTCTDKHFIFTRIQEHK